MKLNFKEFGKGQPLLILHGLLGSLDNWQTLAKRFSEHFHVYTIDQRNHGQSPHDEDIDYDLLSDDLDDFIADNNIENPILMGHSMGGKTVMKYALEHPKNVKALISVDMSPREYAVHHDHIMEALHEVDFNVVKTRKEVEDILMNLLSNRTVVQFLAKNVYWKEKDRLAYRFNLDVLYENLDLISGWPIAHGEYNGPTLFIGGDKVDYITNDDEAIIKAYFPKAQIKMLNSGHWVHAEKAHDFYSTVMNFLTT